MIRINSLVKKFGNLNVINKFNYEFKENKVTCLYGPSGCGKTTLLNIMAGLITEYDGQNEFLYKNVSYVFQEDRLIPWKTVIENIDFVLENKKSGLSSNDYLSIVGLENNVNSYPNELSGGMKRRVALARGLAYATDVLIMDEPFKGLDDKLKGSVINKFIEEWNAEGITVIIVTHDIEEAKLYSDEIIYLNGIPLEIVKVEQNERYV